MLNVDWKQIQVSHAIDRQLEEERHRSLQQQVCKILLLGTTRRLLKSVFPPLT